MAPGGWGADGKHELELMLNRLVCSGGFSLTEAQEAISAGWIAAYFRYVGVGRLIWMAQTQGNWRAGNPTLL